MISRQGWGARTSKSVSFISAVRGVALHWEGLHMGNFTHDQCAGKVRGIQNFHMNSRGWADIAYNFLVCPHGEVFEGRGIGRRSAAQGTNDGNAHYYAICGLFGEGDQFTDDMKRAYLDAITYCRQRGAGGEVRPHSSFHSTACPGPVRDWINRGMPVSGHVAPPAPHLRGEYHGSRLFGDGMRKIDFTSPQLDDQGNGKFGLQEVGAPNVHNDTVVSVNPNDPNYKIVQARSYQGDRETRIVVIGGPPKGRIALRMWVAE